MQPTPEICRHKGILTHWRDYPAGSAERAKALGIEIWSTSKRVETTLNLWETELKVLQQEQPWKALGLKSADEFVKAVVGRSTKEISADIKKRVRIQELREENPDWTQQQIADEVGCTQGYVNQVITKTFDSKESLIIPEHLDSTQSKADFRKLPEELREKVAAKEISLNAAAIQAGVRRPPPSHAEKCVASFRKTDTRLETLRTIVNELEAYEVEVLKQMLEDHHAITN